MSAARGAPASGTPPPAVGFAALAPALHGLGAPVATELVGVGADVALVLDARGTVLQGAGDGRAVDPDEIERWVGRAWEDTVTVECRDKVRELVAGSDSGRERQINQRFADGGETPLAYRVVRLGRAERAGAGEPAILALGKDLSALARMQQRLVNVQQSMERDYAKLRRFETRYRLLFQTAAEAILIASEADARIVEANPVACELLGASERKLVGSALVRWFDDLQRPALEDALAALRVGGKPVGVTLPGESRPLSVRLSMFKTEGRAHLLVRLEDATAVPGRGAVAEGERAERLAALVDGAPDALVVTDPKGQVLLANSEFLDMAQVARAEEVEGAMLADWLGQGGIDYDVITATLREHGSIRLYATRLLGELGSVTEVEVSAVRLDTGELDCLGFAIRNVGRRVAANDDNAQLSPRSVDQLTQLVGRVPLKELVRESTDLIEQLCIQAALKLTGNNRASAAEMLGLSRQSLYVKLRRYSMEDEDDGSARAAGEDRSRERP